jgi:protein-tyrosine phosphatase
MREKIKILFICHGNICRSPMAEFIMKDMVKKAGREKEFWIESAATSSEELGNPVYPPARKKLAEHGIGCEGKTARRMRESDYREFDYLIGMDRENMFYMKHLWPTDPDHKLSLLMEYTGQNRDVSDPWYTRDFESTWQDCVAGCTALLEKLS